MVSEISVGSETLVVFRYFPVVKSIFAIFILVGAVRNFEDDRNFAKISAYETSEIMQNCGEISVESLVDVNHREATLD